VALEKKLSAHMSRDGSQAMVQAVILELSVKSSRRVVLLEASSNYPTRCSEDMAPFAWIQRTLEDVEATLIGLSAGKRRRSAAFQGPDFLLLETRFPRFRGANRRLDHGCCWPCRRACRSSLNAKSIWCARSTYHRPESKDS